MKHILVANDLSPRSANALARAIRLAADASAAIRILHAAESEGPEGYPSAHRRILTEAQIMAEELTDRALDISVCISSARPAQAILDEAAAFEADLIVLGAHGEPRFRDALFGTTGTHVVRHSERPVLIVQNDHTVPYSKVLVALDDLEAAQPLLASTLDVAQDSELFAVHAFYPTLSQTLAGLTEIDREEARQERELEEILAQAAAGRPGGKFSATKHAFVETGEVLSVMMKETELLEPDLVVMGTRRHASYLGSRAVDTVFWWPRDLLVVPEQARVPAPSPVNA